MAVDACGFPIELDFTGSEIHDCKRAPALIEKLSTSEHSMADKGYDSEDVREKRFKKWCRQWKINLIEELNPEWHDLYEDMCS